jgi:hypothetical protein
VVESFDSEGVGRYVYEMPGDERYFDGGNLGPLHFGKRAVFASYDTLFVSGTQDAAEVVVRRLSGSPVRVVRWTDSPSEVTVEDLRVLAEDATPEGAVRESDVRRSPRFRDYPCPETHPAYGALIFDDLGNLWIEDSPGRADANANWRVFNPSGELLGTVQFPNGFRPMAFRERNVVGVWRNSLGVEFVWVLQIDRP